MSEPTAATTDESPQPWWPCPECGDIHFRATLVFERGKWADDLTYVHFDPPAGIPTAVELNDVECVQCGHMFNIHEQYGWPITGEMKDDK